MLQGSNLEMTDMQLLWLYDAVGNMGIRQSEQLGAMFGYVLSNKPDLYLVTGVKPGVDGGDEKVAIEALDIEQAVKELFDLREKGFTFVLLQAEWICPDAVGDVYLNLAMHEV